jgi:carbon-monoxide dehydrogenase medium subunit
VSRPAISEYLRPSSLEEAWQRVSSGDPAVRLLSGGSDLTISAPPEVTTLVDIGGILDQGIEPGEDGSIRIGAGATLTAVLEHEALSSHATGVVTEMMVHVGNPLLRNFATMGGHLARGRLSDVVPVFVALDAEVSLYRGSGPSDMALARYLDEHHNEQPHILTGVVLPGLPGGSAAAFHRLSRTAFDFPILNVCCRADGSAGQVGDVRIVCGATPRVAQRAGRAEALVVGAGLGDDTIETAARVAREEVATGSGWVASAEYRSHLVEVLVARCLQDVRERLTR